MLSIDYQACLNVFNSLVYAGSLFYFLYYCLRPLVISITDYLDSLPITFSSSPNSSGQDTPPTNSVNRQLRNRNQNNDDKINRVFSEVRSVFGDFIGQLSSLGDPNNQYLEPQIKTRSAPSAPISSTMTIPRTGIIKQSANNNNNNRISEQESQKVHVSGMIKQIQNVANKAKEISQVIRERENEKQIISSNDEVSKEDIDLALENLRSNTN